MTSNHIRTHPTILLSPAIVGLLGNLDLLADFRHRFPLPDQHICLPELGHDPRPTETFLHECNLLSWQ
jgi:hypothetical protein